MGLCSPSDQQGCCRSWTYLGHSTGLPILPCRCTARVARRSHAGSPGVGRTRRSARPASHASMHTSQETHRHRSYCTLRDRWLMEAGEGERRERRRTVKEREGMGERGRKMYRILLWVHVCLIFLVQITKQLHSPHRASLSLWYTHRHTDTDTPPLQVLVKYWAKQLAHTTKATHAVSFHARQHTLSSSACPC